MSVLPNFIIFSRDARCSIVGPMVAIFPQQKIHAIITVIDSKQQVLVQHPMRNEVGKSIRLKLIYATVLM